MQELKGPLHFYSSLTALLYKVFSVRIILIPYFHSLARCGAIDSEKGMMNEQRLVRDNRGQSVCEQPGLQRTLGEPVARNFFGVDRAAQGGGIGVRTIHRGDDRSGAMPFGHPVFMPAYIHRIPIREPNQT